MPLPKPIEGGVADPIQQAALRYLARRDRTEAQIRAYLDRSGASPARIRRLIAEFHRLGYLNDDAYARRWAHDRLARKPMGPARLEHELRAQGLGERTIAATIEDLYRDTSEREVALKLVEARAVTPAFLRRWGFSEDTIESVLCREYEI